MSKPEELAVDVADRVLDHLRTMYPDALKAVPASAQISLRNVTISAATASILAAKAEEREACASEGFNAARDARVGLLPARQIAAAIRKRGS